MVPRLSYFICTNPRTGSWLLAGGLEDTHIAGHPSEWFNEPEERLWCERWGLAYPILDYEQYLNRVMEAGSAGADIFGVKCLQENFLRLRQRLGTIPRFRDLPTYEAMSLVFPNIHYIRLIRRDLIRQAISFYRAAQSQVWFSMEGEPEQVGCPAPYDAAEILRHERMLIDLELQWDDYFDYAGLQTLTVYYEDLAANYTETVRSVLDYLGIEGSENITISPPRFRRQSDATTEEWVERYTTYKASQGLLVNSR